MPPKKKANKSKKPPPPLEPLEHISQARERAGNRFKAKKENVNYDVEQNVREIRAILATNAEIFHRCIWSMKEVDDETRKKNCPHVAFTRVGYHSVKVYYDEYEGLTKFGTCPVRSEKSFDMKALICPPDGFDGIIAIKKMAEPFSMFVDYGLLFENALLLHEDVLEPVLAELKDGLMSIQVCLGDIETWVMESRTIIDVLEDLFGQTIETPGENDICECPKGSENVTQSVEYVEQRDKLEHLMRFLMTIQEGLILVFVESKRNCDYVEDILCERGFPTCAIHGDKSQREREDALRMFKTGKCPVMVATDVATRGLYMPNVTQVVNYDLPTNIDDYVRCIGRTGHAGKTGAALSYVNEKNASVARDLRELLEENGQEVPPFLTQMSRYGGGRGGGNSFERCGRFSRCPFRCSGHKVLKELCDSSARHDLAFDVAKESEQRKLKKFLEFIEME